MARDIKQLHPRLQLLAAELVSKCAAVGITIKFSECLRTKEEQDALYAQGRTKPGNIVTSVRGSTYSSQHQWGIAIDFYIDMDVDGDGSKSDDAFNNATKLFDKVGEIALMIGLGWGGNWKSLVDKPHLYLPDWGSTTSKLKQQYTTPDKFMKTWVLNKEETTVASDPAGGYKVGEFVTVSTHYRHPNDPIEAHVVVNPHLNMKIINIVKGARNPYQTDFGTFINDGDIRGYANSSSLAEVQAKEAAAKAKVEKNPVQTNNSYPVYKVGHTYTITASALVVRTGPSKSYPAKTYSQLTKNAKKHANKNGALLKGTQVTVKDVYIDGKDIWILIPSGWIAAVHNGNVYVK